MPATYIDGQANLNDNKQLAFEVGLLVRLSSSTYEGIKSEMNCRHLVDVMKLLDLWNIYQSGVSENRTEGYK